MGALRAPSVVVVRAKRASKPRAARLGRTSRLPSDQGGSVAGLLGPVLAGEALLGAGGLVEGVALGEVVDPLVAAVALDRGPLGAGVGGDRAVGAEVVVGAVVAVLDVLLAVLLLARVRVVAVGR